MSLHQSTWPNWWRKFSRNFYVDSRNTYSPFLKKLKEMATPRELIIHSHLFWAWFWRDQPLVINMAWSPQGNIRFSFSFSSLYLAHFFPLIITSCIIFPCCTLETPVSVKNLCTWLIWLLLVLSHFGWERMGQEFSPFCTCECCLVCVKKIMERGLSKCSHSFKLVHLIFFFKSKLV